MTKLSVNVNKIATIRNARGGKIPDILKIARLCEKFGANGITVHPRPDQRHITTEDTRQLSKFVTKEFNIEGYPNKRYLDFIEELKPDQATLVPDAPDVLTSNQGWDTIKNQDFLKKTISEIKSFGSTVSLFIAPDKKLIEYALKAGADRIELYTGPYADLYSQDKQKAIKEFKSAALFANELGMGVNAGHDLNLLNLSWLIMNIPFLNEVSIGHALISDALFYGLENTVQMYLNEIEKGTNKIEN